MRKVIPKNACLIPDEATCKFNGVIFDSYQWNQELFDGSFDTFEMLKREDTVHVICIVDNKIIVIDDEQPNSGVKKSFPGGRIDKEDESIEDGAKREVKEETGYHFNSWRLVKVSQPYDKIEWFSYIYLAHDVLDKGDPRTDPGEKISVNLLSIDEVKELAIKKVDYIGNSLDILEKIASVEDLYNLEEFQGLMVDR